MSARACVKNECHLLIRKNPRTGYTDSVVYTGSLRNKPKGWKVARKNY